MTIKERETLFKINELVKKASAQPQTTNTPMTGQLTQPEEFKAGVMSLPTVNQPKPQG